MFPGTYRFNQPRVFALGGGTLHEVVERALLEAQAAVRKTILVVEGGTNDIRSGADIEVFVQEYRDLVNAISLLANVKLVIVPPIMSPCSNQEVQLKSYTV